MAAKNNVEKQKQRIEKVTSWVAIIIGLSGTFYGFYQLYLRYCAPEGSKLTAPELVSLLGLVLAYLGGGKLIENAKIEDKNNEILKHLEELKGIEIIDGESKITSSTIEAINMAEQKIRVTNFKSPTKSNDTDKQYYAALNNILRKKNIRYECAILEDVSIENRFSDIKDRGDDILEKMTFYVFKQSKPYLNILIVDLKVAYIGFYTHLTDAHMNTVIRISDKSVYGRLLIFRLVEWYDAYMKPHFDKQDVNIEYRSGPDFFDSGYGDDK
jgi:hypothetical protein